jgi:polysaccharide biosynthesis transport protein
MPEMNHNTDLPPDNSSGGMTLNDIYFILFRRKWMIIFFGLLGIAAATVLYLRHKPIYRSDGKLLVRYIVEDKPLVQGDNAQVRNPDSGGATIINSEIQILTSLDLLTQVAEAVGPSKILGDGTADKFRGAAAIAEHLSVDVPARSDIIQITFRHRDPAVVKPVLDRMIDEYLKRHVEIHRGLGSSEVLLSQHADTLRSQLNATDEELRKLKAEAGVTSLEETKTALNQEMAVLRRELNSTEATLAERRAASSIGTNTVASTNAAEASVEIPADIINQYRATMVRVAAAREREFQYRLQFSDGNLLVKRAREQVAEVEQERNAWETQYPGLLKLPTSVTGSATVPLAVPLESDAKRVTALEAKVQTLKAQLESIRLEVTKLDGIEGRLKALQSKRDLDETNYRYFATGLDRSRVDHALGLTRNNISVVQSPTPATKDASTLLKLLAAALGGGFGFGLVLAFLLEMFVDQSVRRSQDIEGRLHLPLFMSIPYVNGKAMRALATRARKRLAPGEQANGKVGPAAVACAADHPLRPMFEGLRDRMLLHFKGVVHKPKLVGVCASSEHAGTTTLAAGLASTLSETGEGKVLLVDMNQPKGAAHPFFHGKQVNEIGDMLEQDKRDSAMVQENLYLAKADGHERKINALAKQLSTLVPRFKASDYDFIIFDMPRVSATSVSVRLGAMMDLVLLVAEAEKAPQRAVRQAHSLLSATGVDTQIVVNKLRSYVPARLSGDL